MTSDVAYYRDAVTAETHTHRPHHNGHAIGDTVHHIHTGATLWTITGFAPSVGDGEQAHLTQVSGFAHATTTVSRLVAKA